MGDWKAVRPQAGAPIEDIQKQLADLYQTTKATADGSDIVAAGDDEYVSNSLGAVPTTTIAPSLLFDDIGVKRATEEQQKLPYYSPPAPANK